MSAERNHALLQSPAGARRREHVAGRLPYEVTPSPGERRLGEAFRRRRANPAALAEYIDQLSLVERHHAKVVLVRELGADRAADFCRDAFGTTDLLHAKLPRSAAEKPAAVSTANDPRFETATRGIRERVAAVASALPDRARRWLRMADRTVGRVAADVALALSPRMSPAANGALGGMVAAFDRDAATAVAPGHGLLEAVGRGGGTPLSAELLERMGRLLHHDFSNVRLHTDGAAEKMAVGLGARAITVGRNIYFGAGMFAPGSVAFERLLLHELTHVVQFEQGRLQPTGGGISFTTPSDPVEHEARAAESRAGATVEREPPRVAARVRREHSASNASPGGVVAGDWVLDGVVAIANAYNPRAGQLVRDLATSGNISGVLVRAFVETNIAAAATFTGGLATVVENGLGFLERTRIAPPNLVDNLRRARTMLHSIAQVLGEVARNPSNALAIANIFASTAWRSLEGPILDFISSRWLLDRVASFVEIVLLPTPMGAVAPRLAAFIRGLAGRQNMSAFLGHVVQLLTNAAGVVVAFGRGFVDAIVENLLFPFQTMFALFQGMRWVVRLIGQLVTSLSDPSRPSPFAAAGPMLARVGPQLRTVLESVISVGAHALQMLLTDPGAVLESIVSVIGNAVSSGGAQLGNLMQRAFSQSGMEAMAHGLGWVLGTIAFQAVLAALTAGSWVAIGPVLRGIAVFMNWPVHALTSPAGRRFFGMLASVGELLPGIVRNLGRAFGSRVLRMLAPLTSALEGLSQLLAELANPLVRSVDNAMAGAVVTGSANGATGTARAVAGTLTRTGLARPAEQVVARTELRAAGQGPLLGDLEHGGSNGVTSGGAHGDLQVDDALFAQLSRATGSEIVAVELPDGRRLVRLGYRDRVMIRGEESPIQHSQPAGEVTPSHQDIVAAQRRGQPSVTIIDSTGHRVTTPVAQLTEEQRAALGHADSEWLHAPADGSGSVRWEPYGGKHVAPRNVPWRDVVTRTQTGPARYLQGTNVEELERRVWAEGTPVTTGRPWRVMEFDHVIGASEGREVRWMRVEFSGGSIHGHPITEVEYRHLTRAR